MSYLVTSPLITYIECRWNPLAIRARAAPTRVTLPLPLLIFQSFWFLCCQKIKDKMFPFEIFGWDWHVWKAWDPVLFLLECSIGFSKCHFHIIVAPKILSSSLLEKFHLFLLLIWLFSSEKSLPPKSCECYDFDRHHLSHYLYIHIRHFFGIWKQSFNHCLQMWQCWISQWWN